ncbi:MBL fold metallo-hydrolase [Hoeflea prorocentri]|uniref:MBL fold metallo-hydrolase n=1 Tax=Hoeflea prorocentri TaxID=1922333 RepID=A0A9X3UHJ9_9HYPH|nr:MBL fold metallo-hydrolase [Hoeflea prorocentri]MCY6380756.1 MBL fold metallo-hydrolase [Hoeflea prorocentri]MDA5398556.1 MBL fold metallo-hydrolase [Hoeflea prorocentri]
MKVTQRFTILGCGSSPGCPRITGDWGACDPDNPRNRRLRASLLIEQFDPDGNSTAVVIDTGPDFRTQMTMAGATRLDAVVYSHPHADHLHGIDDLRGLVIERKKRMPVYADKQTMERLRDGFSYCFQSPPGSNYPPIVKGHDIENTQDPIVVSGEGGPLTLLPLEQLHGDIISLGFRIGNLAYCSDVNGFPEETVDRLTGLDVLIIDALQYRPHPSHFSLSEALEWIERLRPRRAILTHMHVPLDYDTVMRETPDHVEPGYDMMVIEQAMELEA